MAYGEVTQAFVHALWSAIEDAAPRSTLGSRQVGDLFWKRVWVAGLEQSPGTFCIEDFVTVSRAGPPYRMYDLTEFTFRLLTGSGARERLSKRVAGALRSHGAACVFLDGQFVPLEDEVAEAEILQSFLETRRGGGAEDLFDACMSDIVRPPQIRRRPRGKVRRLPRTSSTAGIVRVVHITVAVVVDRHPTGAAQWAVVGMTGVATSRGWHSSGSGRGDAASGTGRLRRVPEIRVGGQGGRRAMAHHRGGLPVGTRAARLRVRPSRRDFVRTVVVSATDGGAGGASPRQPPVRPFRLYRRQEEPRRRGLAT